MPLTKGHPAAAATGEPGSHGASDSGPNLPNRTPTKALTQQFSNGCSAARATSATTTGVKMATAPLRRGLLPIGTPRERPSSRRGLHATEGLRRLYEHFQELKHTQQSGAAVRSHARGLRTAGLSDWLDHLTDSNLPALADLAKTLRAAQDAAVQGITTRSTPVSKKVESQT